MPRIPKKCPTKRLTIEMPLPVRARLERLRDETGADTLAEVIRRSLAIYETLWDVRQGDGGKIVLHYPEGVERELLLT